ncbi:MULTISPECIES: glutathione S-transferase family protein [Citrobacter]|uniref:Glutathione S-transferase family protein n=1 Tax=Citrobacter amalonaticus TaxID=35703 RepID=A0A8I0T1E1_CITAM|nr:MULTISPECIES: glutathione S-transferase family protein [Citrobacter]HAT6803167.1 glutathione S-transferase [Citrobacter freundii]AMG94671.1 glutathione S-transferase family protein [Citrobacter amalonaticus]AUO64457.1 glutathione S-transferase [Citrobacter freundii complex sp. CFNIH2]EKW2926463.1 glutathione S-transferase family protein [Citrobacter amalonaticus]ELK6623074.1 glutathione S-transferase family protein [Citrobacter amalonaticus]
MIKVYGAPGWGSAISELMLTLADIPYRFVDVSGFNSEGPQRDLLQKINPLCQVPTLTLENGEVMTETAAIALMILDRRPDLAPPVGRTERQQFQRLLIWLVANIYPTFTYADYPERWVPDAPAQLKKNGIEYRKSLYLWLNDQLSAEPYAFGEQLTLLDCYLCVMRTWGPGHDWFQDNTPNISAIADAVCQRAELRQVLKNNEII